MKLLDFFSSYFNFHIDFNTSLAILIGIGICPVYNSDLVIFLLWRGFDFHIPLYVFHLVYFHKFPCLNINFIILIFKIVFLIN